MEIIFSRTSILRTPYYPPLVTGVNLFYKLEEKTAQKSVKQFNTEVMNSDLFTRWLQTEAEILFHQDLTPELFMKRVKPLLEALIKRNKEEILSEKDLQEILVGTKSGTNPSTVSQNSYFDIVDLSLYRAN